MLTEREKIELKYLYELGYRYIARNEIGTIKVFTEIPVRDKVVNGSKHGGYDTWVIGKYPIKDASKYHDLELGEYEFVKWSDEPIEIRELIQREDLGINIGDKVENVRDRRIGIVIRIFNSGCIAVLENVAPVIINTHDSKKTLKLIEKNSVPIYDERILYNSQYK